MNWTHRITLKHWAHWYLVDVSNPTVVCNETNGNKIAVSDDWFEEIKRRRDAQVEELHFSLENE